MARKSRFQLRFSQGMRDLRGSRSKVREGRVGFDSEEQLRE